MADCDQSRVVVLEVDEMRAFRNSFSLSDKSQKRLRTLRVAAIVSSLIAAAAMYGGVAIVAASVATP
jgi:hypothetical protein